MFFFERITLVSDSQFLLCRGRNVPKLEFNRKRFLVNRLKKTRSEFVVNLERSAEDLISVWVTRHGDAWQNLSA